MNPTAPQGSILGYLIETCGDKPVSLGVHWICIQDCSKTCNYVLCRDTGSEKAQEKKLDMAEMMLRCMCGVARLERIRNEINIGVTKVGEIFHKVQKR